MILFISYYFECGAEDDNINNIIRIRMSESSEDLIYLWLGFNHNA